MTRKYIAVFAFAALTFSACKNEVSKEGDADTIMHSNGDHSRPAAPIEEKRIPPADGKYPAITFKETEHDFGQIKQGDKVTFAFEFTNTGEADLLIAKATGSCGCTVPEYPKEAIKAGESGKITVSFNSAGKSGLQHKSVTLTTNTEAGTEKLHIKASINTPEVK